MISEGPRPFLLVYSVHLLQLSLYSTSPFFYTSP